MTINEFMSEKLDEIKNEVIKNIPNDMFDSHEFIRHFSKKYELKYVEFLTNFTEEPFRNVNAQIGRFLSLNKDLLSIKDNGTTKSPNVFGNETLNERWIKQK